MRLTCRTIFILLFVIILIMAYCGPTVEAGIIRRITSPRRVVHPRRPAVTRYRMKHKVKTKTKIRYGPKRPSLLKKITGRG
ncbi:hypothetical protein I4U23_030252 [Adineta vaga]|nr:hypothetical protein I4U23_030252 [Adineta vaga]